MKKLLLLLLLISPAFSIYIPVMPMDNTPAVSQGSGCLPPIDFSIEYDCELEYDGRYSVNTFSCGRCYSVVGDCKGGVVSFEQTCDPNREPGFLEVLAGVFVLFTIIILIIRGCLGDK